MRESFAPAGFWWDALSLPCQVGDKRPLCRQVRLQGPKGELVGRILDWTPYGEEATPTHLYDFEAQVWDGQEFEAGPHFKNRKDAEDFLTT